MTSAEFRVRSREALDNPQIHPGFQRITDEIAERRNQAFTSQTELSELSSRAATIRANALSKLPYLLDHLERNCMRNGMQVHWAETAADANNLILDIMLEQGASNLVRGRTQIAAETGLDGFLRDRGISTIETGFADFILQLANEKSSAALMAEMPKTRAEIAQLLQQHFPELGYCDDPEVIRDNANRILREHCLEASVGLTGVNFAVAETGTLCLVESEGNLRMAATVPEVHIAVAGLEKVIEHFNELPPLLSVLSRSASGQSTTSYVNLITAPRRRGERDGPEQIHLILLDNGRSDIYSDKFMLNSLRCIRCDACMNHCPVYTRVGEQAYGTLYPGPMGMVKDALMAKTDQSSDLLSASTLCGACDEVCPVNIPLSSNINRLRFRQQQGAVAEPGISSLKVRAEALKWSGWALRHSYSSSYKLSAMLPVLDHSQLLTSSPEKGKAASSLHARLKKMGIASE